MKRFKLISLFLLILGVGCGEVKKKEPHYKLGSVVVLKSAPEVKMVISDWYQSGEYIKYTCKLRRNAPEATYTFETEYFWDYELMDAPIKGEVDALP